MGIKNYTASPRKEYENLKLNINLLFNTFDVCKKEN
jgi:hypothetical protein